VHNDSIKSIALIQPEGIPWKFVQSKPAPLKAGSSVHPKPAQLKATPLTNTGRLVVATGSEDGTLGLLDSHSGRPLKGQAKE